MSIGNFDSVNPLDKIRMNNSIDSLKSYFDKLIDKDLKTAIEYINDKELSYTTIFVLKYKIRNLDSYSELSSRNKISINFTNEFLKENNPYLEKNYLSYSYVQNVHSTLKWMLRTGSNDDGMNNNFDRVLDISAILLTKEFKDKNILPLITDMIFSRNRRGLFTHDLEWALFESRDPYCLYLLANRLLSSKIEDVKLAGKLLNFIPGMDLDTNTNSEYLYLSFLDWFEENNQFLQYTGESFQYTNNPIPYVIDYEAKYLCKIGHCNNINNQVLQTINSSMILSKKFHNLDRYTKSLLANFSYKMRKKDMYWWSKWIKYPLSEQIKIARNIIGVIR